MLKKPVRRGLANNGFKYILHVGEKMRVKPYWSKGRYFYYNSIRDIWVYIFSLNLFSHVNCNIQNVLKKYFFSVFFSSFSKLINLLSPVVVKEECDAEEEEWQAQPYVDDGPDREGKSLQGIAERYQLLTWSCKYDYDIEN